MIPLAPEWLRPWSIAYSCVVLNEYLYNICNFVKKTLRQRCFPMNFAKCLRTSFFIEHLRCCFFVNQPFHDNCAVNSKKYFRTLFFIEHVPWLLFLINQLLHDKCDGLCCIWTELLSISFVYFLFILPYFQIQVTNLFVNRFYY